MSASPETDAAFTRAEADRLFRAIRFALFAIALGLSYFSIRASMAIPHFDAIFRDMLNGQTLPWLTNIAFKGRYVFLISSWLLPLIALWAVFMPLKPRSFYVLGVMAMLTIFQSVVIVTALSQPLVSLVNQLGDTSGSANTAAPR